MPAMPQQMCKLDQDHVHCCSKVVGKASMPGQCYLPEHYEY